MRRFIAFIVLTFSILALVVFNVQGTVEGINWSQEYDRGTEVLYNVNVPGDEAGTIDIDKVVDVMGNRLEEAGATNYKLESSYNNADHNYEVKVVLGSRNTSDIDNILRSTMTSGEFSIFTTDGTKAAENCVERGSAEVYYNEAHEAYIQVKMSYDIQYVADQAKDVTGDSLLVLWQNKTDSFDYSDLADSNYICPDNNLTSAQLKERVLAVIDLSEKAESTEEGEEADNSIDNSNYWYDEDDEAYYLSFKAVGYSGNAESSTQLNANSAHSYERILNSELLEYDITQVYRRAVAADYGNNAIVYMICAAAAAIVVVCAYLLIAYGFTAIAGCVTILLTTYIDILILYLLKITVSPVMILALVASLAMSANMLCLYYKRTKEEAYRGRAIGKASNEGFRKTISTAVDSTVVMFALGIILALISRESVKGFSIFFIFASLLNILFVFLIGKYLNNLLLNSKVSGNNKLFKLKKEYIADLDGNTEKEIPEKFSEKINVKKASKKSSIFAIAGVVIATAALAGFGIMSNVNNNFTNLGVFNFSSEETYGRIEVRSADTKMFETVNDSGINLTNEQIALDNFVYYIENVATSENVKVKNAWTITDQKNPYEENKNYIYFYADLDNVLESSSDTFNALETYVRSFDDDEITTIVRVYTVNPGIVTNDFNNTLVLMSVTVGITLVYFLVRYRYTFSLAAFTSLTVGSFIAVGLVSLFRLEASAYVGVGVLVGLLLNMLFIIPLGNRLRQLKNESKVKVTTYDQREEIGYAALKSTISQYVVSVVGFTVVFGVLLAVSPINMWTIYVAAIISLLVNGLMAIFTIIPMHLWCEKHFKFTKAKSKRAQARQAKRERIAKANRNKGAEPEEIIIPGIND